MLFGSRVKETSNTVGTADIVLAGAAAGTFQSFSTIYAVGDPVPYSMAMQAGTAWEDGIGTWTAQGTIARTFVSASSSNGNLVSFPSGVKDVVCTLTAAQASKLVFTDAPLAVNSTSSHLIMVDSAGQSKRIAVEALFGTMNPSDLGYDIILLAGQSNMAGRGVLDTMVDIADPRVFQFGCTSADARYQTIFSGADPLHMEEGVETAKVGPATAFARAYADSRPTNRRVLLVPACRGGTPMVSGTALWGAPSGSLYTNAISQANAALVKAKLSFPNSRVVGIAWIQGESDGDGAVTQAAYAAELKEVIAGMRAGITGASDAWFLIGGMVPEAISTRAGYATIDLAHKQVANEVTRCVFVAGPSGYTADSLHYNANGARIMGARMALATVNLVDVEAPPVTDTAAPSVTGAAVANASPTVVTITFNETLAAFTPAASAFAVTGRTVSSVARSGSTVSITVAPAFLNGESATVSYIKPGINPLQDAATNQVASFGPIAVANNVGAVATKPATMAAPTVTPGDGQILVGYVAPADGGSAITNYTAIHSTGPSVTDTANPLVLPIANGVAGTVTIFATNGIGNGDPSPASVSVTPTASAVAGYSFESDTVGAAPANIAVISGVMEVTNTGVTDWAGKYARFTGAATTGGAVYAATLSEIPSSNDRTVTWKRGRSGTGSVARDGMLLRAIAGTVTGTAGARPGYMFQVSGSTNDLRLYKFTTGAVTQLGTSFALADTASRYLRASAIGTTLKFEYSADGVAWTTAITVTDATHTSGGVDYVNGFSGTNPATAHIDDVSWS